jgi:glycosyltransferase involved in cell wall biosynthesis
VKISVALCTHNGARFIEEQVASILLQTVPPNEIVISDDASRDDTVNVARELIRARAPLMAIVVIENPVPLGVTANFEQAMLACTGDVIALCDQDDIWHPERLEQLTASLPAPPSVSLRASNAVLVDDAGLPIGHTLFDALEISAAMVAAIDQGRAFDELLRRNLVTGATSVASAALVAVAAPFPFPWVHDEWLAIIAAALGGMSTTSATYTDYRQHSANEIGARRLGLAARARRIFEPRGERNEYLLLRAIVLRDRLIELGPLISPLVLAKSDAKVRHHAVRAALPRARVLRIPPVLSTGAYGRYSRGRLDIVRDLLQPA